MDNEMLVKIKEARINVQLEKEHPLGHSEWPLVTWKAIKRLCTSTRPSPSIKCSSHGSVINLRERRWIVISQEVGGKLLGRPVIEALGIDCQKVLEDAADIFGGNVDISNLVGNQSVFGTNRIGRVLNEIFRDHEGADHSNLADDGRLNLDPEDPTEK